MELTSLQFLSQTEPPVQNVALAYCRQASFLCHTECMNPCPPSGSVDRQDVAAREGSGLHMSSTNGNGNSPICAVCAPASIKRYTTTAPRLLALAYSM